MLYGTSNPGGVINYITRQPSSRTRAEVTAGFGNNGYRRYSLSFGGPIPIGDGKKLSYLVDATWFEHEHGERQRSLQRYSLAPVLRWTPFTATSITLRGTRQKDDFISSGGLLLLPPNSPIRASTSTPRIPHWSVELGRDYNIHSSSSWVDVASGVVELELKQRLGPSVDLRANLVDHYRPRSSFREGGSNFLNAGTNVAVPFLPDNLAPGSPVSLSGIAPAYDPVARTGWRTVAPVLDDRVERRRTLQVDMVGRMTTGPLHHTLLLGFERNLESISTRGHTWFKLDAAGVIRGLGTFTYAPFDPVSAAAKDLWYGPNQPPLEPLPIASLGRNFSSNSSIYSSLTTTFLKKRGLILIGGRKDDVKGGTFAQPVDRVTSVFGTPTSNEGTTDRVTPQAGVSFRITDPITGYAMFSQSVNPRIAFQPLRTSAAEERLFDTFTAAGEPVPDFDALPWGTLLDPNTARASSTASSGNCSSARCRARWPRSTLSAAMSRRRSTALSARPASVSATWRARPAPEASISISRIHRRATSRSSVACSSTRRRSCLTAPPAKSACACETPRNGVATSRAVTPSRAVL